MMVKSGLEKIILKFNDGLQSCCSPVQKNVPRKAELAWQVSRYGNFNTRDFSPLIERVLACVIELNGLSRHADFNWYQNIINRFM
jgi:hypothetical protein